jgi:hypothetical protein
MEQSFSSCETTAPALVVALEIKKVFSEVCPRQSIQPTAIMQDDTSADHSTASTAEHESG